MGYALLRSIDANERRDESGEAIEYPWNEDTSEQPDIILPLTPPEPQQTDCTDAAEGIRRNEPVHRSPTVRTKENSRFGLMRLKGEGGGGEEKDVHRHISYANYLVSAR